MNYKEGVTDLLKQFCSSKRGFLCGGELLRKIRDPSIPPEVLFLYQTPVSDNPLLSK